MVKVQSYTKAGSKQESGVTLAASVFGVELNHELMDLAYRAYLANGRSAQPQVLNRGDVRGGGRKPWRQKGTGRARVGSSRVPNWRGGGVVFGPTGEENHTITVPVKMKRLAIRQALSAQAGEKRVSVIEAFDGAEGKVKPTLVLMNKLKAEGQVLLVVEQMTDIIDRATRNLVGLRVLSAKYLNVFDVLNADQIIITRPAVAVIEAWLGEQK